MFVIEDAHWIDATSESLLSDLLSVVPQASALVLITYRPEYEGRLTAILAHRRLRLRHWTIHRWSD